MLLFEAMTQLDLTGPLEVFARFPETKIYLLAKSIKPVSTSSGLTIIPDTTFENCPRELTVLFVPGGPGVSGVLKDPECLDFVRSKSTSTYITSVCTGSLILAACGLLDGFRATTHWLSMDLLRRFGVEAVNERVVIDRNRITGAGVTSGIDFGLTLCAILFGEQKAKEIQLMLEYDPQPPFNSGHPSQAEEIILKAILENRKESQQRRLEEIDNFLSR